MEGPSVRRHWTWSANCCGRAEPLKKLVRAGLSHRSFDALWEKDLLPRGYRRLPRGADGPPATHYYELELGHRGAGSDLLYAVCVIGCVYRTPHIVCNI